MHAVSMRGPSGIELEQHYGCMLSQVGRTGMNMGADAEVYNLTELPTAAPAIWEMMTASASPTHELKSVHTVSEDSSSAVNLQATVCS